MMKLVVAELSLLDKIAKEKPKKVTPEHFKQRQLKNLFTQNGLKAKLLSSMQLKHQR